MYDNPWECDCELKKLTPISFINNSYNAEKTRCKNFNEFLFKLNFTDLCNGKNSLPNIEIFENQNGFPYIIVGLTAVILTFLVIAICCYCKYKKNINSWCSCYPSIIENANDEELYDAFISFSHEDEDLVLTQLVPKLEQEPKIPYKLCFHTRDWSPGEWIQEQIYNSVYYSHRTIIILSKNFLNSPWSLLEFRVAIKG